jgi:hypothetical protein
MHFETFFETKFSFGEGSCENEYKKICHNSNPKLLSRFPNHELMLTFGVIYLNFWANDPTNVMDNFHQHTIIIKAIYYSSCKVGKDGVWMKVILDGYPSYLQCSFFKMIMIVNIELIMKENFDVNLVTWLWANIGSSYILKHKLSKCMKLSKISCVQVLGSMKDEQCFSTMAFRKNKLKNHLITHLDLCT